MSADFPSSIFLDARTVAIALKGSVTGRFSVSCPGPGHSPRDRSLSIQIDPRAPLGFTVYSHAGDDFRACRDHVAACLGLGGGNGADPARTHECKPDSGFRDDRVARAARIWNIGDIPHGSVVEQYLEGRRLELPWDHADWVRYNPATPWHCPIVDRVIAVPAMVAPMRHVLTDELTAVHKTRLDPFGVKLGRRMQGIAQHAAVKLDLHLGGTLVVGEGIETCWAARQLGHGPVWAMCSTSNIAALPVLDHVDYLVVVGEKGPASAAAFAAVSKRWRAAGKRVELLMPPVGDDFADTLVMQGDR